MSDIGANEASSPATAPKTSAKEGLGWIDVFLVAISCSALTGIVCFHLAERSIDEAVQTALAQTPKIAIVNTLDQKLPTDVKSQEYQRVTKALQDQRDEYAKQGYIIIDGRAIASAPPSLVLPVIDTP